MKTRRLYLVFTGLSLLTSLADFGVLAHDPKPQMRADNKIGKGEQMIELEINFPKQVVQVDDKVPFTIEFRNTRKLAPITFWWYNHPFFDFVTVRETVPSGKVFITDSNVYATVRETGYECYTLKPGEKKVQTCFFYAAELGEHLLEAEFHYLGIRVKATPVKIKVVPKEEKKQ